MNLRPLRTDPRPLGAPCSCPSVSALAAAALAGTILEPSCLTHQAAEIAAAEHERTIAAVIDSANDLEAVLDRVADNFAAKQTEAAADVAELEREHLLVELTATDPLAGTIARAVGSPMTPRPSPTMPLNASDNVIAAALGMTVE